MQKERLAKCYEKSCSCPTKRRSHFKKYPLEKKYHVEPKKRFFRKKKWKFLKKKQFKEKTLKVYFICRKPSHFAKNYSRKEKAAELLEQVQIYVEGIPFSNVESLFSFDNDYSPQALVVMAYFTSKEDLASLRPKNPNHLYILAYYSLPNRSYSHSPSAYPPGNLFQTHSSYSTF